MSNELKIERRSGGHFGTRRGAGLSLGLVPRILAAAAVIGAVSAVTVACECENSGKWSGCESCSLAGQVLGNRTAQGGARGQAADPIDRHRYNAPAITHVPFYDCEDANLWKIPLAWQDLKACFVNNQEDGAYTPVRPDLARAAIQYIDGGGDSTYILTANGYTIMFDAEREVTRFYGPDGREVLANMAVQGTAVWYDEGPYHVEEEYTGTDRKELLSVTRVLDGTTVSETYFHHTKETSGTIIRRRVTEVTFNSDHTGTGAGQTDSRRFATTIYGYYGQADGKGRDGKLKFVVGPEGVKRFLLDPANSDVTGVSAADPGAECDLDDVGAVGDDDLEEYREAFYDYWAMPHQRVSTGGTGATTMTDAATNYGTQDCLKDNYVLWFLTGPNAGLCRTISANLGSTITVATAFPNDIAANHSYMVCPLGGKGGAVKKMSGSACGGCPLGGGGDAEYGVWYGTNPDPDYTAGQPNTWREYRRTTVLDGGNPSAGDLRTVEFINEFGQVVYDVKQEMNAGAIQRVWITHSKYDLDATDYGDTLPRRIQLRHPSACTAYFDADDSPSNGWVDAAEITVDDAGESGLVDIFVYGDTDDAVSGTYKGRLRFEKVCEGTADAGAATYVKRYQYEKRTAGGQSTYHLKAERTYDTAGTTEPADGIDVTWSYTFYGPELSGAVNQPGNPDNKTFTVQGGGLPDGELAGLLLTITSGGNNNICRVIAANTTSTITLEAELPNAVASGDTFEVSATHAILTATATHEAVPTAENGPNQATSVIYWYERQLDDGLYYNRWTKHEDGSLSYTEMNPDGQVVVQIEDVLTDGSGYCDSNGDGQIQTETEGDACAPNVGGQWTNTAGVNLDTRTEFDAWGRVSTITSPGDRKTMVAYSSTHHSTRGLGTTTRLVTLTAPHLDIDNDYDYAPVQIDVTDLAGRTIIAAAGEADDDEDGNLTDDWAKAWTEGTTYIQNAFDGTLTARRESFYDNAGRLIQVHEYHSIPTSGDGDLITNYYRSFYLYDPLGRQVRAIRVFDSSVSGYWEQVTATIYDDLDRTIEIKSGVSTDQHDMTSEYDADPTFATVASTFYDEDTIGSGTSGVGDGRATTSRSHFSATEYTFTEYHYDYRGRLRGAASGEGDTTNGHGSALGPFAVTDYDHLGRATASATFSAEPSWSSVMASATFAADTITDRAGLSKQYYDNRGRPYMTEVYRILDGADAGKTNERLVTENYYDARGRLVATEDAGSGAGREFACDGAGRQTESRAVKALESTKWSGLSYQYRAPTPGDDEGGNDGVIEIQRTVYDKDGGALDVVTMELNHTDADGISLDTHDYVQSAEYRWYDPLGRLEVASTFGTGTTEWTYHALTRPATKPSASGDDGLVTLYAYDTATGRLKTVTDPKAAVTKYHYDALGRRTHVIENYKTGGTYWQTEPDDPAARDADECRITRTKYNGLDQTTELTAIDPHADGDGGGTGDNQTTRYLYRDLVNGSLVTHIIYPDSPDADHNGSDQVKFAYHRDGTPDTRTSQAHFGETATVITYYYDDLRRPQRQAVTTPGTGIDQSVLAIKTAYDSATGQPLTITSYADAPATGTIVNQVAHTYDGLGRLVKQEQSHSGAVVAGTSPAVVYTYDATATSSIYTHTARLVSTTYPNARAVYTLYTDPSAGSPYEATGGIGDVLSRPTALAAASARGSSAEDDNVIAAYYYNGLGRTVRKDYPTPDLELDHYGGTSGTYAGFDRYGRIVKHLWYDDGNDVALFDIRHAYDHASNRLYADRQVHTGASQVYAYDELNRLTAFSAGPFDTSTTVKDYWLGRRQGWELDGVGNHTAVVDFNSAAQSPALNWYENAFNNANEIASSAAGDRKVRGTAAKPYRLKDEFSADTTANFVVPGGGDTFAIAGGAAKFTALAADNLAGHTEDEARGLALIGEPIGPTQFITSLKFPSGAASGQAGLVFGYKDVNDYWMLVVDLAAQKRRLYHVVDGAKGSPLAEVTDTGIAADAWLDLYPIARRNCLESVAYTFGNGTVNNQGFPSGKIGLVTNFIDGANCVLFDYLRVADDALSADLLGRWADNAASVAVATDGTYGDRLVLSAAPDAASNPVTLRNVRLDRFQATFSVMRAAGSSTANLKFAFNLKDPHHYNYLTLYHAGTGTAPVGCRILEGALAATATGTGTANNVPAATDAQKLWYRVEATGSAVTVKAVQSSSAPSEATWTSTSMCYSAQAWSSVWPTDGGHLGFAGASAAVYIDDLTIRCDGNTDGDFGDGDSTDMIEIEETFDISSDFAAEKFVHDARGNLTYDGRYAFTYDAWNRLVKVQRAWRDSSTGDLHTGSTIATMAFDGSGRRIKKAVDNSGDWDCTYHYYLDGQRIVETRDGSDLVLTQQVWGLNYIDELVQTGVNQDVGCSVTYPDGPEDAPEVCERFFWILQDANYNVIGSAAATGLLLERYEYDPYGRRTVFSHNWLLADMTDDGAVNVSEMALLGTFGSTNDPADRRDLNGDGAINICDWSMMVGDYRNAGGIPNDALCTHPRGESGRGVCSGAGWFNILPAGICDYGHQGLPLNKEFDTYHNGARDYHFILMRMNQTDPTGYPDGMNGKEREKSNPVRHLDPFGLTSVLDVLSEFFKPIGLGKSKLWVMRVDDEYTARVRSWQPVTQPVQAAKNDLTTNCKTWESGHQTDPSWKPVPRLSPDPNAFGRWVPNPPGTDPLTCGLAFGIHLTTATVPKDLWTGAIGSFGVYVTVDKVDCDCKAATLRVWMYNAMSRQSFGTFAYAAPWWSGMATQYMWWTWTEEHTWADAPAATTQPAK